MHAGVRGHKVYDIHIVGLASFLHAISVPCLPNAGVHIFIKIYKLTHFHFQLMCLTTLISMQAFPNLTPTLATQPINVKNS